MGNSGQGLAHSGEKDAPNFSFRQGKHSVPDASISAKDSVLPKVTFGVSTGVKKENKKCMILDVHKNKAGYMVIQLWTVGQKQ